MIGSLAPQRWAVALIATASLALSAAPSAAGGQEAACPTPDGFGASEATLPKTAKALASGSPVVIVALGGSSTLGVAAGGTSLAWPSRLAVVLAGRFSSARVKVVNLAMSRQTAREAAGRLAREVLPLRPTLLIWETAAEPGLLGFNVYRAASLAGPWVQVNAELLPGRGGAAGGGSYVLRDAPGAGDVYYRLEEVDATGKRSQLALTGTRAGPDAGGLRTRPRDHLPHGERPPAVRFEDHPVVGSRHEDVGDRQEGEKQSCASEDGNQRR